jgi:hypothetical protein
MSSGVDNYNNIYGDRSSNMDVLFRRAEGPVTFHASLVQAPLHSALRGYDAVETRVSLASAVLGAGTGAAIGLGSVPLTFGAALAINPPVAFLAAACLLPRDPLVIPVSVGIITAGAAEVGACAGQILGQYLLTPLSILYTGRATGNQLRSDISNADPMLVATGGFIAGARMSLENAKPIALTALGVYATRALHNQIRADYARFGGEEA